MKPLSIQDIRNAVAGKFLATIPPDLPQIAAVSIDSRLIPKSSLFVAIKGERHDGHNFLADVADAGAIAAVVEKAPANPPRNLHLIQVADTRVALGKIATQVRKQFRAKVIGVAGSNGKTSTKHLINAALCGKLHGTYSPKSFNNEIGVPLTILPADPQQDYVVIEMGTNNPGEIHSLTMMALPDIAVITNCSAEHLQGLGDLMGVKRENASVVEGLDPKNGLLIVNGDDPELLKVLDELWKGRKLTFGFGKQNDLFATDVQTDDKGVRFTLNGKAKSQFFVPMLGRHSASNALAAIAVGRRLGLTEDDIKAGLANASSPDMRLQLQPTGGVTVLNDAYNANPASMKAALETASLLPTSGRRIAILADMLELGKSSDRFHREIGEFAATLPFHAVVCIGPQAKVIVEAAKAKGMQADRISHFPDSAAAALEVPKWLDNGDLVLLKGSRGMRLERIATAIAEIRGVTGPQRAAS
jgi:UDP-N-acetylmuramoyl-tripeptide--D-alanyl-D-alanine ligase